MNTFSVLSKTLFKKNSYPIYLIQGVTGRCDSKCQTCFAWKEVNQQDQEMTIDEFEKIYSTFQKPLLTLILTGGEVFLRKDIVELIKIFYTYTKCNFLAIPTNGIRYEQIAQNVEDILSVYPGNLVINISLDGIAEMHDEIRGVAGNFEKVIKLYKLLENIKSKNQNLSIGINTVLNSTNQNYYQDIFNYVKTNFKNIDQHNFEIMRGDYKNKNIFPPNEDFLLTEIPKLKSLLKQYNYHKSGVYQKFLQKAKLYYHDVAVQHQLKTRLLPCYAGSLSGVIDHLGNVYPCELLNSIGNLRDVDYDFNKIWFSKKATETRNEIKRIKCVCTHSCFQFVNILFNPIEYGRIIRQ